jgi:hypothetical protein
MTTKLPAFQNVALAESIGENIAEIASDRIREQWETWALARPKPQGQVRVTMIIVKTKGEPEPRYITVNVQDKSKVHPGQSAKDWGYRGRMILEVL